MPMAGVGGTAMTLDRFTWWFAMAAIGVTALVAVCAFVWIVFGRYR